MPPGLKLIFVDGANQWCPGGKEIEEQQRLWTGRGKIDSLNEDQKHGNKEGEGQDGVATVMVREKSPTYPGGALKRQRCKDRGCAGTDGLMESVCDDL